MQEISTPDKLQIAYVGPGLRNGQMPMVHLAAGLRGQALLIHRVKDLLFAESFEIQVAVDAGFESGSLVIPVNVLTDGLKTVENFLAGQAATALANLFQFLGFFGLGVNLYSLFRQRKGRKIEKPDDLPRIINLNISVENVIRIYNDTDVQEQLRRTIHPLHHDGIDEFQTRRNGKVIESVFKADLQAADEAELRDIIKDEEVTLDIEKTAWRRSLAWHFRHAGISFDAKIEDDEFWKNI